jgi:hypothetical protein
MADSSESTQKVVSGILLPEAQRWGMGVLGLAALWCFGRPGGPVRG